MRREECTRLGAGKCTSPGLKTLDPGAALPGPVLANCEGPAQSPLLAEMSGEQKAKSETLGQNCCEKKVFLNLSEL